MLVTFQLNIVFSDTVSREDSQEIAYLIRKAINRQITKHEGIHPQLSHDNFAKKIEIINDSGQTEVEMECVDGEWDGFSPKNKDDGDNQSPF